MFDLNNPPDDEDEPFVGQTFGTLEEAHIFYGNYAKQHGFSVRKDRAEKRKNRTVRRDICCHREGKKPLKPIDISKHQRNRMSIKCECKAHMRVTLKRSFDIFPEEWHVTKFVKDHNHDLLSVEEMRFLPANRIITPEDEQQILLYKEAGLSVRHIIRVMELQKQVDHGDLPFFDRDIRNLFTKVKKTLGSIDAMDLIQYMKSSKEKNIKFHYVYTLDAERRLENLFWCHPQCFDWYEKFGDVVVFDTTYKVNAYDMPCAPFVCINNHGKTIFFGCALLRDETKSTFRWLMKTFVTVMKKPPKTIITNQDPWMSVAISVEMPSTKHSFCIWHITSKFSCWFSALLRSDYQSWCSSDFYKVYWLSYVEEFEDNWWLIVAKYKLQENKHVDGLYKYRKFWAPAYLRSFFFGGMTSTNRSESINAFIKRFVFSHTSLRDFVKQMDLAVIEIENRDVHDKMLTTLGHASLKTKSPLEDQAFKVLTPYAFQKFQEEFQRANQYLVLRVEDGEFIIKYFEEGNHKYHKVSWDGNIAFCSCKNFEFWGILCRHIFRALLHNDCFQLPAAYLPLRWCIDSLQSGCSIQDVTIDESLMDQETIHVENAQESGNDILCPPKSVTKGRPRKRRLKGGKKMANKKHNTCSICKEVGHTKPKCQSKENILDLENVSSDMTQKKKKDFEHHIGVNPVFTLKY